jgi:hypothetical protein
MIAKGSDVSPLTRISVGFVGVLLGSIVPVLGLVFLSGGGDWWPGVGVSLMGGVLSGVWAVGIFEKGRGMKMRLGVFCIAGVVVNGAMVLVTAMIDWSGFWKAWSHAPVPLLAWVGGWSIFNLLIAWAGWRWWVKAKQVKLDGAGW